MGEMFVNCTFVTKSVQVWVCAQNINFMNYIVFLFCSLGFEMSMFTVCYVRNMAVAIIFRCVKFQYLNAKVEGTSNFRGKELLI